MEIFKMNDATVKELLIKIKSEITAGKSIHRGLESDSYNRGCDVAIGKIAQYLDNRGLYQLGDAGKHLRIGE